MTYLLRNVFENSKFTHIECCHAEEGKLVCEKHLPIDVNELIGIYPARHSELIKCCNYQNLIDRTKE